jgi:putative hydrolase of the HAD superfamily
MTVREACDVNIECVVLDAMGVVFRAADDVAEQLVPFVRSQGGVEDVGAIEAAYLDASRGSITADAFWSKVGLSPSLEDEYLSGHALIPGVREFLAHAHDVNAPVWLLSNDVERWSRKLRNAFALDSWLCGAVISSDAAARKPDAAIYRYFMRRSGYDAPTILFVDDREKNVAAASALGIQALHFDVGGGFASLTPVVLTPRDRATRDVQRAVPPTDPRSGALSRTRGGDADTAR